MLKLPTPALYNSIADCADIWPNWQPYFTIIMYKVYVKHLITLENNVNMWNYTVKSIQHFLCYVSVADFADTFVYMVLFQVPIG